jgi:hypothetical protein
MIKTSNYRKTENIGNRIILSLMYHLTHIKKSFLMGDLLSLPTKNHNLIKFTTHFE